MTYYRVMLREGGSRIVDAGQARRLIEEGKAISVRELGRQHPLYRRCQMNPELHSGYLTK